MKKVFRYEYAERRRKCHNCTQLIKGGELCLVRNVEKHTSNLCIPCLSTMSEEVGLSLRSLDKIPRARRPKNKPTLSFVCTKKMKNVVETSAKKREVPKSQIIRASICVNFPNVNWTKYDIEFQRGNLKKATKTA